MERGADRAARALGFRVRGFSQFGSRDEVGVIPSHIARDLTPVSIRGARAVWPPTLDLADVLVIVVPTTAELAPHAGIGVLRTQARARNVPQIVIDPSRDIEQSARHIRSFARTNDELAVMVWGPRATRWAGGERMGWELVKSVGLVSLSEKRRVLVVDTQPAVAQMICNIVTACGHEAMTAVSRPEALERFDAFRPNVAVVALDVPDLNELVPELRVRSQPLFVAALVTSNETRGIHGDRFDRYVVKPVDVDQIRELLDGAGEHLDATSATIG